MLPPVNGAQVSSWQRTSGALGSRPTDGYAGAQPRPEPTLEAAVRSVRRQGVARVAEANTLTAAPRAFRIGQSSTAELSPRADGGYCIEGPTRTIVYHGEAALNYLRARTHFAMDTEVAVPQGGRIQVSTGDQSFELNEPGAILLGTGAVATVKVLAGTPLVVRSQNAPAWYDRFAPTGPHQQKYGEIARINGHLYNWHTHAIRFDPGDLEVLKRHGVVQAAPNDGRYVQWRACPGTGAFRRHLEGLGLAPEVVARTMPLYEACRQRRLRPPTEGGYDHSGLAFDAGKVVAYTLRGKFNLWTGADTEWLVNSTAYAGSSEPFAVGVSYVRSPEDRSEPTDFHRLRPAENLHRHPDLGQAGQTEAYLVQRGRGALLTVRDAGPEVHVLEAGHLAVIEPGVVHCVMAYQGPYEHLCAQMPSTFQYGLQHKAAEQFETFGLQSDAVQRQAAHILGTQGAGSFDLGSRPTPSGFGGELLATEDWRQAPG